MEFLILNSRTGRRMDKNNSIPKNMELNKGERLQSVK